MNTPQNLKHEHCIWQVSRRYVTKLGFVLSILGIALGTFLLTNCSSSKPSPEKERNDYYRSIVKNEFPQMVKKHNADARYLIIVDYSIPSNQDRLFLWDTEKDDIVEQFWCAHGLGGNSTPERPEFSNTPGSQCSSLGWYKIERGTGVSPKWGYTYHAVDGLSTTNSNARRRELLLHPWESVDYDHDNKIQHSMALDGRCAGCFTTSTVGWNTLHRYIQSRQKRILLYAIDGQK